MEYLTATARRSSLKPASSAVRASSRKRRDPPLSVRAEQGLAQMPSGARRDEVPGSHLMPARDHDHPNFWRSPLLRPLAVRVLRAGLALLGPRSADNCCRSRSWPAATILWCKITRRLLEVRAYASQFRGYPGWCSSSKVARINMPHQPVSDPQYWRGPAGKVRAKADQATLWPKV